MLRGRLTNVLLHDQLGQLASITPGPMVLKEMPTLIAVSLNPFTVI